MKETVKIDVVNIGLVVLALILAIFLPFRLFLFSYAILGPLHYLTEIHWLKERNYFVKYKGQNWKYLFYGLTVLISLYPIGHFFELTTKGNLVEEFKVFAENLNVMITGCFFFAVSLIFVKKGWQAIVYFILSFLLAFTLNNYIPNWVLFAGVFLPTIIHVYIFTILFILFGAFKSKSKWGIVNAILMLLVPVVITQVPVIQGYYKLSAETFAAFQGSNFSGVSGQIAKTLGQLKDNNYALLSPLAIKIQMFISFAYTYHYLNWFSKTSVIGWSKSLSKKGMIVTGLIWLASICIYFYDYKTGFVALFFLSFLHVILEFPLNSITIKEVFGRFIPKIQSK